MSKTIYDFTVPALLRGFSALSVYLAKAEAHVQEKGLAASDLIEARLVQDMFSFSGQIQRASDKAKNGAARLAGISAPSYEDNEKSFDELRARIDKTVVFLNSLKQVQFEGAEEREVELRFGGAARKMSGFVYLTQMLLPDFYFHVATAHGILRSHGVAVGKTDFLGSLDYMTTSI